MEKNKVALYLRVSSDEQKKEGLSVEAQERKLRSYCGYKEWEIYKTYKDEGISAKSIKGRKSFIELLKDAKEKKFSAILITKLDRAFRNVKEALITLEELKKEEIDFISISEDFDTTTAMGKFFFLITSGFAELERNMTSDRVKDILRDKFERGIVVGKIPFGYDPIYKDKKRKVGIIGLKIKETDAEIIRDIFNLTLHGKNYREICQKYNLKPQSYYNIIKNPIYAGFVEFGNIRKKGNHTPIISEEVFNKVYRREV